MVDPTQLSHHHPPLPETREEAEKEGEFPLTACPDFSTPFPDDSLRSVTLKI